MKLLSLMFVLLAFCSCSIHYEDPSMLSDSIIVKKNLSYHLFSEHKNIYVDVQNDAYDTIVGRRMGEDVIAIESEIDSILFDFGVERKNSHSVLPNQDTSKLTSGLLVECHFRRGLRFPMLIRHFNIKTIFVVWVNIKLIDLSNHNTIGEVEYDRPLSKHLRYSEMRMFEKMLSVKIDMNTGKVEQF